MKFVNNYLLFVIIFLIKIYQKIVFFRCCRFYPSCSAYTIIAFKKYGIKKGIMLFFKRIIKCHPFNKGGYDPI
ncbi:MAG: membrane protein insertion efficiency factor YidD [bacterium]